MKIYGSTTTYPLNLYANRDRSAETPNLVYGTAPGLSHDTDTLDISPEARQLAASDVIHHSAVYFGTTQIHESLTRLLRNQPPEVREAAYGMIQSNFIMDVTDEEQRAALLELGLAQAEYIADNYMSGSNAAEFMDTMRLIAAISKTRTVDPVTNEVRYDMPPQRPIGAPDDYIPLGDLMRKYEPETMEKLQEAIASGKGWNDILQAFAQKVVTRGDWTEQYWEDAAKQREKLEESIRGPHRFDNVSTASLAAFVQDVQQRIARLDMDRTGFLMDNVDAFLRRLGQSAAAELA